MLAFNNDAAAELRQRLKEHLNPHGLPAERVTAKTFHAFGLDVIAQATGKKPSVAPWVESGQDLEMLLTLIDEIKDRDLVFRTRWDLFRIVLGQDLPAFGKEEESPDAWSRETNRQGFWTLNNEVVKSRGEQIIANWLFYNGVHYEYERPYEHDTGDAQHRQYNPDFYFPDVHAYLEHWAVDEKGNPPATFVDYKEGMVWKRALHARHGTRLLETTMADLWSGQLFEKLARQLTDLGIELDPNPDRPVPGRQPIENPRLARTIRMFQTHVKNNRLSIADVRRRLDGESAGRFRFRHQMFLDLFEPIHEAWEHKLREGRYIDFEDMLNQAAEHIEQGRWASPYELVMVDEFQDASQARARLAESLVSHRDACLFAVGDDWQSINQLCWCGSGCHDPVCRDLWARQNPEDGDDIPVPTIAVRHQQRLCSEKPSPVAQERAIHPPQRDRSGADHQSRRRPPDRHRCPAPAGGFWYRGHPIRPATQSLRDGSLSQGSGLLPG